MKKWINKRNIAILVVVVLVGGWWYIGNQKTKNKKLTTKVVVVEKKDVVQTLTLSGKIKAEKMAELKFLTSGRLSFLRVKSGDSVKNGEWLAGLDTGDLQAAVTKAWYAYLTADANAKEVEDLVKNHDKDETFAQKNDRIAAQVARDSAYETWLSARRAADYAILKAPFDGVVTNLNIGGVGEIVGITSGLTVVDPASLYFEVEIDESDLGRVNVGQNVGVKLDAFSDKVVDGKLEEIEFVSRLSDTGANVYPARVKLTTDNGQLTILRLGMKGDAVLVLGEAKGVLALPIEAVIDGSVVTPDGKKLKVETGLESENDVEIKSGLAEGDKVVVK